MDEAEPPPSSPSPLRRRNSIATTPTKLILPTNKPLHSSPSLPPQLNGCASSLPLNLELLSLKSSLAYTSLKDLLPSAASVNSPTPASASASAASAYSGYQICIRNRLVKQAAWAYLQPMSSSPDSCGPHFLRRLWLRFSANNPISSCFRFICLHIIPGITRLFDRILCVIRFR